MDASKVLNEEERKKYSQKSIRLDNNSSDGQSSENEPVNLTNTPPIAPTLPTSPTLPTPPIVASPMPQRSMIVNQNVLEPQSSNPNQANSADSAKFHPLPPLPKSADLAALVQSAQTTFFQDVYNEFTYDPRLTNKVVQGHLDIFSWNGSHSAAFLNIMETVVPFMHLAAMKSPQFRELCSHDQRLLLKNNAILLREYLTARYLIAETGTEQLVWAFGPSDSISLGKFGDLRFYA